MRQRNQFFLEQAEASLLWRSRASKLRGSPAGLKTIQIDGKARIVEKTDNLSSSSRSPAGAQNLGLPQADTQFRLGSSPFLLHVRKNGNEPCIAGVLPFYWNFSSNHDFSYSHVGSLKSMPHHALPFRNLSLIISRLNNKLARGAGHCHYFDFDEDGCVAMPERAASRKPGNKRKTSDSTISVAKLSASRLL